MVLDLVAALLLGSMLFFAAVVAPAVFKILDGEPASRFLRGLFPRFFLWGIVLSGISLLLSFWTSPVNSLLIALILAGFIYSRQVLTEKINRARDQWLASDGPTDKARFDALHKRSVMINVAQIALLLIIIVL